MAIPRLVWHKTRAGVPPPITTAWRPASYWHMVDLGMTVPVSAGLCDAMKASTASLDRVWGLLILGTWLHLVAGRRRPCRPGHRDGHPCRGRRPGCLVIREFMALRRAAGLAGGGDRLAARRMHRRTCIGPTGKDSERKIDAFPGPGTLLRTFRRRGRLLFEQAWRNRLPVLIKGPTGVGKTRFVAHTQAARLACCCITVAPRRPDRHQTWSARHLIHGGAAVWSDGCPNPRVVRGAHLLSRQSGRSAHRTPRW